MSESTGGDTCDSGNLRVGIALALIRGRNLALEDTVLRIIRIALFVLVPTVALAVSVAACSDDTTGTTSQDMTAVVHDMATTGAHDLAHTGD